MRPPLRLIINNQCKGNCFFCHREGNESDLEMPLATILTCAEIAEDISVPLSLTGGEPTLRSDLGVIINEVLDICKNINVSLTTNGYRLGALQTEMKNPIDTINLSISSLKTEIAMKYQAVDPIIVLKELNDFPAKNKEINIVITKENYAEIYDIISYCIISNYSITIMTDIVNPNEYNENDQKILLNNIENLTGKTFALKVGSTPSLVLYVNASRVRIKHPTLSSIVIRKICDNCSYTNSCTERVCSVRVYPNGKVSPCLKQQKKISKGNLDLAIKNIYSDIEEFEIRKFNKEFLGVKI